MFDTTKFVKPKNENATQIQCEVYRRLKDLNIEVYVEYKSYKSRFDLITVRNNKIISIIETKKKKLKGKPCAYDNRQREKYMAFNIPLFYVIGMEQVNEIIEQIKILHKVVDKDLEV